MTEPDRSLPLDAQLCFAVYSAGIAIQRAYKPRLDELGLTYPQYLVLNVLWNEDGRSVGSIADELMLESSTLTPLLKRLEAAGLVGRRRNPDNERQVIVDLTARGHALEARASCIGEALIEASNMPARELGVLNEQIKGLRNAIYRSGAGRAAPGQ